MFQAEIREHAFEPQILFFKLFQQPDIGNLHTAVFGLPVVIGRI